MLEKADSALIVIDVQGKLAEMMHERDSFFTHIRLMIQGAKILNLPVLWLEQIPEKLGTTRPEIADLLTGLSPIPKTTFSACGNARFMEALGALSRRQMLLTGIETHICVCQTAMDLIKTGREVHIVSDAVASRFAHNKTVGIDKMKAAGACITSVETALFELLKEAQGSEFREIVRIIK